MPRPLRSRNLLLPGIPRALAAALGLLLVAPAAAEEIDFEEVPPANANCCYLTEEYADLGAHFETVDDGSIWGGMSAGDPGRWRLEGTQGPAFLGFNGSSYELTLHFDAPVVGFSLDAARSFGSSGAAELHVWGLVGGAIVEQLVIPLGVVNQWVTATLTSEVDTVRWKVLGDSAVRPYGVDHLRWELAAPPEPDPIEVELDLVAHGPRHRVPLARRGMLPVVVYGSEELAAADMDTTSLVLGDAARPRQRWWGPHVLDVDGDGLLDLFAFFSTAATGLQVGDEWLCLDGQTLDGVLFTGCTSVEVVEPPGRRRARGHDQDERDHEDEDKRKDGAD